MKTQVPPRRGRPATGRALSNAERARRYRVRLRARGLRLRAVRLGDPLLASVRFAPHTLLTPGEQDALRRFCAGFARLPCLPRSVAVFGSRARGDSHARSDLDVAVLVDAPRNAAFESALSLLALEAQRPYRLEGFGIWLRPVPFYAGERTALSEAIGRDLEVVWTRP